MKLLVSTHSLLLLVEIDDRWRVRDHAVLAEGYHFGATTLPHDGSSPAPELLVFHDTRFESGPTKGFLRRFRLTGEGYELAEQSPLGDEWGDVHQITPVEGGYLVANTARNSIALCDHGFRLLDEHRFEGVSEDVNHINSVYLHGDHALGLLHNKSRKLSELVVCGTRQGDLDPPHTRSLWHRCCHNLFIDGSLLTYNASADSTVVRVDLATDRIVATHPTEAAHNKGLSVVGDKMIIGLSEHASRSQRGRTSGKLLVLSRDSLRPEATIDLDIGRPTGNINEIRCIDRRDEAIGSLGSEAWDWGRTKLAARNWLSYAGRQGYLKVSHPIRQFRKSLKK